MDGEGAAGALVAAVAAALRQVPGLSGVSDGAPIQAADGHAVVEAGPETDWGHKSGEGAEIRFAVLIRCGGEQPARTRSLTERARQAVEGLGPGLGPPSMPWRLVTLVRIRSRLLRAPGPSWTGVSEFRARMLRG
jgi:hypothetical protein